MADMTSSFFRPGIDPGEEDLNARKRRISSLVSGEGPGPALANVPIAFPGQAAAVPSIRPRMTAGYTVNPQGQMGTQDYATTNLPLRDRSVQPVGISMRDAFVMNNPLAAAPGERAAVRGRLSDIQTQMNAPIIQGERERMAMAKAGGLEGGRADIAGQRQVERSLLASDVKREQIKSNREIAAEKNAATIRGQDLQYQAAYDKNQNELEVLRRSGKDIGSPEWDAVNERQDKVATEAFNRAMEKGDRQLAAQVKRDMVDKYVKIITADSYNVSPDVKKWASEKLTEEITNMGMGAEAKPLATPGAQISDRDFQAAQEALRNPNTPPEMKEEAEVIVEYYPKLRKKRILEKYGLSGK